jgi:large subunit ribosomal protein L23
MALLNLFKKKKEPTKKPTARALESSGTSEQAERQGMPTIAAPSNAILRSFHVSEKSARGMTMNQYTFIVDPRATKSQIRDAVHKSYQVDVIGVNLGRLPAKQRFLGRHRGVVAARRKAIVTLKEGHTIAAAQQ